MTIRVSAFAWVPPFAQGLVRDLRVRWALEEAGLPYEESLVVLGDHTKPDYVRIQPFGQIPAYEEDDFVLFESGAIVLHIGERSEQLLPKDPQRRARAQAWVFAALSTVEPSILFLIQLGLIGSDEARAVQAPVTSTIQRRLDSLAKVLDARDYLDGQFTVGDLMMTTVLRTLRNTDLVRAMPVLDKYQARCEARPAFQRALAAQLAAFRAHEPAQ
jgi:glutathione S-transferase